MNPVKNVTNRYHSLAALTVAISVRTLEGVDCRVPPAAAAIQHTSTDLISGRILPGHGMF